jgi:hypothetical protein
MRNLRSSAYAAAVLAVLAFCLPAFAGEEAQVNALLVLPTAEMAFDHKFQDFLAKNGAKLLKSYPPSVFEGFIPQDLDKELGELYGVLVFRERVDDWSSFAKYGEKAVFAVNTWNKRFVADPPAAPLPVSLSVLKGGRKGAAIDLNWNEVMKAVSYRLQISTGESFGFLNLETELARNTYRLYPAFWDDGVYYWRVSGVMTLNNGEIREGAFSAPASFAVSKKERPAAQPRPAAPVMPAAARFTGRPLSWGPAKARYYRLQLSNTKDFSAPLADVFTDTCTYKASELPIKNGKAYYMRVRGADTYGPGEWSDTSEITVEPKPARKRARR